MEFNFSRLNSHMEHDHIPYYFNYTSFSDHEGLRIGTSVAGGVEIFRGSVDMRETIQREKDGIREEILAVAAGAARRRVLEAEVRRELMLETQINGGGYRSSSVMFAPAPERYGDGGRHRREIVPFLSPENGEPKVINLGKLDGLTNRKRCSGGGEIGLGVAPTKSVTKQPSLIKNSRKCVSIDSKKEDKKTELSLWCSMCGVGASSEIVMSQHKEGKKHMKNLEKLNRESRGRRTLGVWKRSPGMKPKKTKRKQKSHKARRHQ